MTVLGYKEFFMKKTINVLGYTFLTLLALLVIAFLALALAGRRLDRESKAYVDNAVVAIATDWDVDELRKRASPELDDSLDYDDVQDYFDSLKDLGSMTEYQGSTGESTIAVSFRYGYEITAQYSAIVDFEAGNAQIDVLLTNENGEWQILDFKVTPGAFSDDKNIV